MISKESRGSRCLGRFLEFFLGLSFSMSILAVLADVFLLPELACLRASDLVNMRTKKTKHPYVGLNGDFAAASFCAEHIFLNVFFVIICLFG